MTVNTKAAATALIVSASLAASPLPSGAMPLAKARVIPTGLFTCHGTVVVKPAKLVLACADANAGLTRTDWTTWDIAHASGTTDFALNLCVPYCAASRISHFPDSKVIASAPVVTKHHGRLFSELVVTYKLNGKVHHYPMSWKGDPAFS